MYERVEMLGRAKQVQARGEAPSGATLLLKKETHAKKEEEECGVRAYKHPTLLYILQCLLGLHVNKNQAKLSLGATASPGSSSLICLHVRPSVTIAGAGRKEELVLY